MPLGWAQGPPSCRLALHYAENWPSVIEQICAAGPGPAQAQGQQVFGSEPTHEAWPAGLYGQKPPALSSQVLFLAKDHPGS